MPGSFWGLLEQEFLAGRKPFLSLSQQLEIVRQTSDNFEHR